MTDFLLSYGSHTSYDDEVDARECDAYDEASMMTCRCASCESYRIRQEGNAVYERHYQAEMERVKAHAKDPYYQSAEYLELSQRKAGTP
jgi:hypothetical protein